MTGAEAQPNEPQTRQQPPPANWTFGRVLAMICAGLVGLLGIALLLGGLGIFVAEGIARDDDGYLATGEDRFASATYAITTDEIDLELGPGDWVSDELLGFLRVGVKGSGDEPVFVGIARTLDVSRYLSGVRHDVLADLDEDGPRYELQRGAKRPQPPGRQDFWVAASEGAGEQQVEWEVESGVWSIVVMNADAAPGVDVDAELGVKAGWVIWVGVGLFVAGIVLTVGGVLLILAVSRRAAS